MLDAAKQYHSIAFDHLISAAVGNSFKRDVAGREHGDKRDGACRRRAAADDRTGRWAIGTTNN